MDKARLLNTIFEIGQSIETFDLKHNHFPTEEEILQQHEIELPYGEDVLKGWISAKMIAKAEYYWGCCAPTNKIVDTKYWFERLKGIIADLEGDGFFKNEPITSNY